jgi:hypothetical protein
MPARCADRTLVKAFDVVNELHIKRGVLAAPRQVVHIISSASLKFPEMCPQSLPDFIEQESFERVHITCGLIGGRYGRPEIASADLSPMYGAVAMCKELSSSRYGQDDRDHDAG